MSREIRFRAWHESYQCMCDPNYIDMDGDCYDESYRFDGGHLECDRNYVLMQFTGLTDKNGKEIYEGDILDITSELFTNFGNTPTGKFDTTYKEVFWKEDGWAVRTLKSANTVVGSEVKILTVPAKFGVVIGNIYENPELLNKGEL